MPEISLTAINLLSQSHEEIRTIIEKNCFAQTLAAIVLSLMAGTKEKKYVKTASRMAAKEATTTLELASEILRKAISRAIRQVHQQW